MLLQKRRSQASACFLAYVVPLLQHSNATREMADLKACSSLLRDPRICDCFLSRKKKERGVVIKLRHDVGNVCKKKLFVYKMRTYIRFCTHPRGIIGWRMRW